MDFVLTFIIAGLLSVTLLFGTAIIYARRLRSVYDDISPQTARSLEWFGLSNVFLGLVVLAGIYLPELTVMIVGFTITFLVISQINLLFEKPQSVLRGGILTLIMSMILAGIVLIRIAIPDINISTIFTMIPLGTLTIAMVALSLYLLRASASPFTASMFVIVVSLIISAGTASMIDLFAVPQFFALQALPVIIAAAVMVSMLRPWRRIISRGVAFFAITVGVSIAISAILSGNYTIFIFALTAAFAGGCTVIPLDFFLEQAIVTRARTPVYIAVTLFFVSILAITHMNNFSIAYGLSGGTWDDNILFLDWIFGVIAVCTFTLAAMSATLSEGKLRVFREALIAFGGMLVALGATQVRWIDLATEIPDIGVDLHYQRWELDPLYIPLIFLLIIGFIGFIRVAQQLSRAGSTMAGARFLAFMFAALAIGIVAMYADVIIGIASIEVLAIVMSAAGLLLIFSNPRAVFRAQ